MLNPQNPGEFPIPGSKMPVEEEGARKRRLEHNSSDSLAESPKRSLTDEEGGRRNLLLFSEHNDSIRIVLDCSVDCRT